MAADMFFKIDELKGDSEDAKHKEEIEVLAFSWGASQPGTMHSGTGGGAGKVNVHDLSFTKNIDPTSALLFQNCCNGTHFKKATLTVRKAGGKEPVDYLKITFEEIIVSSISTGGSGGPDRLTENVTLNFAKFHIEYKPQKADGTAGAVKEAKWNIPKNAET